MNIILDDSSHLSLREGEFTCLLDYGKMMKKYFVCLIISVFLGPISLVNAGALEEGIQSFEKKDYKQAEKLWLPLAKEGDARAQYNLYLLTQKSVGKEKATEYLTMSKAEGLVDGYFVTLPVSAEKKSLSDPLLWLNQQQKESYTLQLATGKSKPHLQKMQKKLLSTQLLEQPENLYIQATLQKEQAGDSVRYILIYGVFSSYQQAKDQVSKLPESIQKSSPWIRKFSVVQSIVSVHP